MTNSGDQSSSTSEQKQQPATVTFSSESSDQDPTYYHYRTATTPDAANSKGALYVTDKMIKQHKISMDQHGQMGSEETNDMYHLVGQKSVETANKTMSENGKYKFAWVDKRNS